MTQDSPYTPRRTSQLLKDIIQRDGEEYITVQEFTHLLGRRSFVMAILVFSLPNSLPIFGIPGFSTLTGLPIAFIALQMMAGKDAIWLPQKVAHKRFSQARLKQLITKILPALEWLERYLHPRWLIWQLPVAERLLGLAFLILSLIIALPIPGANFLPAFSMSLIALGMLERDGLFVSCSLVFSVFSLVLLYKLIVLFFTALIHASASYF